ncbi:hypothetical protein B0H19DRAFT_1161502 [Mycena capillaripes]|nr:hypothetical protein B0H19DRAFT_1161502 [Mycena capillaripes]
MTSFQNLNEDVLLVVLAKCDVYTVLSASRLNKLIRTLALSKYVWVALVADLIATCLIDAFSDPDYTEYSAPKLLAMVKRLVCGPRWGTPALHRKLSVESPDIRPRSGYAKLLPGGRFFTFESYNGRYECWSLASRRCVWNPKGRIYAADVLDGENTARFLVSGSSRRLLFC